MKLRVRLPQIYIIKAHGVERWLVVDEVARAILPHAPVERIRAYLDPTLRDVSLDAVNLSEIDRLLLLLVVFGEVDQGAQAIQPNVCDVERLAHLVNIVD